MSEGVNKQLKAYLSYRKDDDITVITRLLTERNIAIYDSTNMLQIGDSLQLAMRNAIRECDFVVLLYTDVSPYIAFETGVAVAFNIPIMAIIHPSVDDPYFLYDSTWVRATPSDAKNINFTFDIFIRGIEYLTKRNHKSKSQQSKPISIEPLAKDIHKTLDGIDFSSEVAIARFLRQVFNIYNIKAAENPRTDKDGFLADYSIWSNPLQGILSNPIQIEIKFRLTESILDNLEKSIKSRGSSISGSWLIFYVEINKNLIKKLPHSPNILFIDIREFAIRLMTRSFNDTVKQIRNELTHNI